MGGKGRGGQRRVQPRQQNQMKEVGPAIASAQDGSADMERVAKVVEETGIEASGPPAETDPGDATHSQLVDAYRSHVAARDVFERAQQAVDDLRSELERQQADLAAKVQAAERATVDNEILSDTLAERAQQLRGLEADLARRETALAADLLATSLSVYVEPLEQRRAELFEQFTTDIARSQDEARASFERMRTELVAEHERVAREETKRIEELERQRIDLEAAMATAQSAKIRHDEARADLHALRARVEDEARAVYEDDKANLAVERSAFNRYRESRTREIERILAKTALIEAWEAEVGDVDAISTRLEQLDEENDRLRAELARRSSLLEVSELQSLRSEHTALVDQIQGLRQQLADADLEREGLRSELLAAQVAVDNYEGLATTVGAYRDQVRQLRSELQHLTEIGDAKVPFRECTQMDQDPKLQQPQRTSDDEQLDLQGLVDRVQWILFNRHEGRLSYRKQDLRLFTAGLAMSRLHILEGVSGTGKTTLPIAFAEALRGGSANVAIQAGWRDRQDLLGYFNEFQGYFRESEFLRGMYRATTPAYDQGIFFVVLDEMNLSKVEQYFADYLKALEDAEGADRSQGGSVPLMDRSDLPLPRNLRRGASGGVELPLPENVWFIGTANQDETTQSFAPKTQSRSHLMELPETPPSDEAMKTELPSGVHRFEGALPARRLRDAFDRAVRDPELRSETERARRAFTDVNRELTEIDPSLALAPRFFRQLDVLAPVLVACGGTIESGIDHLTSTKVIRRMNERFNIQDSHRSRLDKALATIWSDHGLVDYAGTRTARQLGRGR